MTNQPDCAAILEKVSAYLDQELDAATCAEIDRHCAGCDDCTALIAGLRQTVGLCRETGSRPLPADVRARAQASIRKLLKKAEG